MDPQPMPPGAPVSLQPTQAMPPLVPASPMPADSRLIAAAPANVSNAAFDEICTEIVREQAGIISHRLALEQIQNIQGLSVEPESLRCHISGNGSKVINDVVTSFSLFFGSAAVEVCREAAARYLLNLPPGDIPPLLKTA